MGHTVKHLTWNRRMRKRTYGGVRGRGREAPPTRFTENKALTLAGSFAPLFGGIALRKMGILRLRSG
jgi:hypothetical protein